jgi:hypothetical protein
MNKKSQLDLYRKVGDLRKALRAVPLGDLLPLLADRYKWPIAILDVLERSKHPMRAAEIIAKVRRYYPLEEITPNYVREIIAVLRRTGVRIESGRSRGYWME